MKVVFIQLADETRKIAVLEMFGQDGFGKSFVLRGMSEYIAIWGGGFMSIPVGSHLEDHKTIPLIAPPHHGRIGRILKHSWTAISKLL